MLLMRPPAPSSRVRRQGSEGHLGGDVVNLLVGYRFSEVVLGQRRELYAARAIRGSADRYKNEIVPKQNSAV
jgi:hypothetical protein